VNGKTLTPKEQIAGTHPIVRIGIDAGPLLGSGGISEYVGPLVRTLIRIDAASQYQLLLRKGWATQAAIRELQPLAPVTSILMPDRVLASWWKRTGRPLPLYRHLWRGLDVFLATCLLAPVLPRGKVVSIVYDLIPLRLPSLFPQRDAFREQILQLLRRSSTILAISEHTKQDLVELLGEDPRRVIVAHPGQGRHMHPVPSTEYLRVVQRYRIHTPYILYVGSLGPHKNVITLLRAYETARLDGRITGQLVLVGSDRWGADSLRVLETLRVRKDVVLTGFAPAADLPALYSGATCLVFPSLYEGFGLPVLEAMACGTPVIVSNRGALPEVVGEAGTLVDPLDADAFAKAICDLLNTPARRAERSARALAQAAAFSWDRSAEKVMAILHRTADTSAAE
jgi:glycosyltransferase involved in cell wall biosynthesis